MKRILIFVLIFLSLSERVLKLEFGGISLGLLDVFLITYFFILIGQRKILIDKFYLLFITYFILSNIYIYFFINQNISLTAIFTIPMKLALVKYIASGIIYSKKYIQLSKISFIILMFGLLLFSDGSPFFSIEILNRNETIAYLLALVYIIPDKKNRLRIILLSILLFSSFIVQSRQLIVGIAFSILIFMIINYKYFKKYTHVIFFLGIVFYLLFNNIFLSTLDEYNKNRYSFSSIEDRTRSDRMRFFNILYAFNNLDKSPLIGQGSGSFIRANPLKRVSHNSYVTSIYENGIIGFILFLLLLYKSIPDKNKWLSFFIFFVMVGQLFFIESIGKFFIYMYFVKSYIEDSNVKSLELNEIK